MKSIFKKLTIFAGLFAIMALVINCGGDGPKIGVQGWTFRNVTLSEAVEKAQKLGIECLEAYPGEKLGGGLEGKFGPEMDQATRQKVLEMARAANVKLVSFGVVNAGSEEQWREIFAFAKDMKLQWISTEPPVDKLPMLDKLANEYGIPVAIHNHGTPSPYANPETTKAAFENLSKMVGVCADTGHWARSGVDPVKALQLLSGRVITLHLKDINEFTKAGRDVPFGTGVINMGGILAELKKQNFKGVALIEYEHMSPKLDDDVAACVEYLKRSGKASTEQLVEGKVVPAGMTSNVADVWSNKRGSDSKKWGSPQDLFAPDLSNAEFNPGSWTYENGIITGKGNGELWTKESYGNFVLTLEFRCQEKTNSGVFLRCSDTKDWLHNTIEVQVLQGDAPPREVCGAIFDCLAPKRQVPITPGQWYSYMIIAKDNKITVYLDGEEITKMNLDDWKEPHKNPDGSKNKFNKAYKDMAREGRIGLQYHGQPIEYRNVRIEKM